MITTNKKKLILFIKILVTTCNMNKPLINGLLNVDSKIECNNIEDYKKFYPVTTVDEINIY